MRKYLLLISFIFIFAGCDTEKVFDSDNPNGTNDTLPPAETEVKEGDFVYRLFTEKDVYDTFGGTAIFAELTYVGELESIEISHASSPFYFPLEERTRGIDVDYAMNTPLIYRTLKKDEPYRDKYTFAGGFSDQNEEEYVDFVKTLMDRGFPEGEYIIHGSAQFNVGGPDETVDPQPFNMQADIGFTVVEPYSR